MKKTFPLRIPGKVDQRVIETVKSDIRKYVKRERRKALPEGFEQWNFNCKVGPDPESAAVCPLTEIGATIDGVVEAGATRVYVEVLAEPAHRIRPGSTPA